MVILGMGVTYFEFKYLSWDHLAGFVKLIWQP